MHDDDASQLSDPEARNFVLYLGRARKAYFAALDDVPAEAFLWQPPAEDMNSLSVICTHAVASAEWWVLGCAGNGSLDRDRDVEFSAHESWDVLRDRFEAWQRAASELVNGMSRTDLDRVSRHPAGDVSVRQCLAHTIEHLNLHRGHVEITLNWWKSWSDDRQ